MRVAVLGDTHLLKLNLVSMFGEAKHLAYCYDVLNQVEEYCDREHIDLLIQTGDVFDTPFPPWHVVEEFIKHHKKRPNLQRRYITGNHDVAEVGHGSSLRPFQFTLDDLNTLPHVKIFSKPAIEKYGRYKICYLPWPKLSFAKSLGPNSLNIAHVETFGATFDSGRKVEEGKSVTNPGHWIIGHLHIPHTVHPNVHYVGSIFQMNFGETLPKSFRVVTFNKKGISSRMVPIRTPFQLTSLKIATEKEFKQIDKLDLNPNHYISIQVKKRVAIPLDVINLPNVFISSNRDVTRIKEVLYDDIAAAKRPELSDPTHHLPEFLGQRGFSRKAQQQGVAIVKKVVDKLTKSGAWQTVGE